MWQAAALGGNGAAVSHGRKLPIVDPVTASAIMTRLLAAGGDPLEELDRMYYSDPLQVTPLHAAAVADNPAMLRLLAQASGGLRGAAGDDSLLLAAVSRGAVGAMTALVDELGVDPVTGCPAGAVRPGGGFQLPLFAVAISNASIAALRWFHDRGVMRPDDAIPSPSVVPHSSLMFAIMLGHRGIARELLAMGARADRREHWMRFSFPARPVDHAVDACIRASSGEESSAWVRFLRDFLSHPFDLTTRLPPEADARHVDGTVVVAADADGAVQGEVDTGAAAWRARIEEAMGTGVHSARLFRVNSDDDLADLRRAMTDLAPPTLPPSPITHTPHPSTSTYVYSVGTVAQLQRRFACPPALRAHLSGVVAGRGGSGGVAVAKASRVEMLRVYAVEGAVACLAAVAAMDVVLGDAVQLHVSGVGAAAWLRRRAAVVAGVVVGSG